MGVLVIRAYYLGSKFGPLIFGNSHRTPCTSESCMPQEACPLLQPKDGMETI